MTRDFRLLWASRTVSTFGSLTTRMAMPFAAILLFDATPLQIAIMTWVDLLPGFLFGLFAGVWVDRLRRRPLLIATALGQSAVLLSVPAAGAVGALRLEHLYVVSLLLGVASFFRQVGHGSYLPTIVTRDELPRANSRIAATESVVEVAAFASSGWLVQLISAPLTLMVDILTSLGSAGLLRRIEKEEPPAFARADASATSEVAEGIRVVLGEPLLRAIGLAAALRAFGFQMIGTVYMIYAVRELGFDPGAIGMIAAVGGASAVVGALAARRLSDAIGMGPAMILGLASAGLAIFFLPIAQGAGVAAAVLLLAHQVCGDGIDTIWEINRVSLVQAITADRLLGRVNGSIHFAVLGAMLGGTLLGGVLGETAGLRATLVAGGIVTLAAAGLLTASPLRSLRTPPHERLDDLP